MRLLVSAIAWKIRLWKTLMIHISQIYGKCLLMVTQYLVRNKPSSGYFNEPMSRFNSDCALHKLCFADQVTEIMQLLIELNENGCSNIWGLTNLLRGSIQTWTVSLKWITPFAMLIKNIHTCNNLSVIIISPRPEDFSAERVTSKLLLPVLHVFSNAFGMTSHSLTQLLWVNFFS